jgi:hypothetical protein
VSDFDRLLKRRSSIIDRKLGETWYLNSEGSNEFYELRVTLQDEPVRTDLNGQVLSASRSKVLQIYKDPNAVVGGKPQGGLARPVIDRHQFITQEDRGNPNGVFWVVKEIVGEDAHTWTLRCEQKQLMRAGTTNVKR